MMSVSSSRRIITAEASCQPFSKQPLICILIYGLFAAQWPRPPVPLSTLQETPRDVPSKTRGQDGFATSFPVGLLHPLQHAGLARRTQGSPSSIKWDSRRFYTTRCHSGLAFKAPFAFSGIATYRSSRTGPGFLEDWEYRDPHLSRA